MPMRLPEEFWINHDFVQMFKGCYNGPETIYHYTSPEAMLGILNNDKVRLRFSRITCLNDYSEGLELLPLFRSVCIEMAEKKEINSEFVNELICIEPQMIRNFTGRNGEELCCDNDVYVCCFSKQPDELSLWNYYIKNDRYLGYSIGFKSSVFQNIRQLDHGWMVLASVIYDEIEKKNLIRDKLKEIFNRYVEQQGLLGGDEREIMACLSYWMYIFKNHHSSNEQEVRALLFYPHSTDICLPEAFLSMDRLKFRIKEGIVIPYFEIEFDKSCFIEICLAPNPRLQNTKHLEEVEYKMIDEFLRRNKYSFSPDAITVSTVPARY